MIKENLNALPSVSPRYRQRAKRYNRPKSRWLKTFIAIALLLMTCVTAQKAESSSWYSGTPFLTARDQFTGGVINGKIYVFGGNGDPNGLNLKSTEVFDPAASQWSFLANNEHNGGNGVEELSGAVVNNKLYVFGGWGGSNGVINFVEEYNPITNTWISKASMPTTRSSATAVAYNGEIYVFGGRLSTGPKTAVVEAFNPASNTWRSVTNIPFILDSPSITVVEGKVYVIGGHNGSVMVNTVMSYDFATNIWNTNGFSPLPTPRVFPYATAAPVINGKIYLIGGIIGNQQSYSECSVVEIYDTTTNTWSTDASFPAPLANHLSLALNGTIFVAGGETGHTDSGSIRTNAVWKREILSKGDLNSDGNVNLTDTIMALQVMSGMNPNGISVINASTGADVNNDNKIGLAEAIYSLQDIAGLRIHPFGISGWWDLYVPAIQTRKMDAYYLRQTGFDISGTNILTLPITGNINGTTINLTLPPGGEIFNGTLNGDTITGIGTNKEMGEFTVNVTRSNFHFTNFYPGESIGSTGAHFAWTTSPGAEKYYILIDKDNAAWNCSDVGGCTWIWSKDGIIGTSVSFNDDGKASGPLMPGNNYRIRVYSRLNSQTGMPVWNNPNTFIDTTMDVAFKVVCNAADINGVWSIASRDATMHITQTCNTFSFYIIDNTDPRERTGTGHINGSTFDLSWDEPYYNNTNVLNGTVNGNTITGSGVSTADASTWTLELVKQPVTYSNAILSGHWVAQSENSACYFSADGNGIVTDVSGINMTNPPGTYQVSSDGSISMSLTGTNDGVMISTGAFTSLTSGTITFNTPNGTVGWEFSKVSDLSLCQGNYSGTLTKNGSTYSLSFFVNSNGEISNFTSNIPGGTSASGRCFGVGNTAVMRIRTNITTQPYDQISAWGALVNGQFTGSFENNSGPSTGTIFLTKLSGTYSIADLNGIWADHALVAADSPQPPGWWLQDSAFNNGLATFSNYLNSNGQTRVTSTNSGGTLSADGTLTVSDQPSFHGTLSRSKNLLVAIMGQTANNPELSISIKKFGTFTAADLTGPWYMHYLMVGDGTNANLWLHGTASLNDSGAMTLTLTGRSDGAALGTNSKTLSLASDGSITEPGSSSSFNGIMSADKNMVVFTVNDHMDTNSTYGLGIMTRAGATFTQADLTGNWVMHALMAKDGGNRWVYGNASFDSTGNLSYSGITTSNSSNLTDSAQAVLASNGIVTFAGVSDVHGVMTPDKNILIVYGNTNNGSERTMLIYVKR